LEKSNIWNWIDELQPDAGNEVGPIGADYYDPEDITDDENIKEEELEKDPDIAVDLAPGNPGIVDDKELDPKYWLIIFICLSGLGQ